jgi:hypothetical protein
MTDDWLREHHLHKWLMIGWENATYINDWWLAERTPLTQMTDDWLREREDKRLWELFC